MPKQKAKAIIDDPVLKKHRRIVKIVIITLLVIALSLVAYRVWLNVHFLITDDLVLSVSPMDLSLKIHYLEKRNVSTLVQIENNIFCNAICSYSFYDISENKTVAQGDFSSEGHGKVFNASFPVEVSSVGSGQKLYSFDATCHNVKTWLCLSNEANRKRSSFITLNYDLSEIEKTQQETLRQQLINLTDALEDLDIQKQGLDSRFFELGHSINMQELERQKSVLDNDFDALVLDGEQNVQLWQTHRYDPAGILLAQSKEVLENVIENMHVLNGRIANQLMIHNSYLDRLNSNIQHAKNLTQLYFLNKAGFDNLITNQESVIAGIAANTFTSYESLNISITGLENQVLHVEQAMQSNLENATMQALYVDLFERRKYCELTNCSSIPSTSQPLSLFDATLAYLESACIAINETKELLKQPKPIRADFNESIIHQSLLDDISLMSIASNNTGFFQKLQPLILTSLSNASISSNANNQNELSAPSSNFFSRYCNNTKASIKYPLNPIPLVSDHQKENITTRINILIQQEQPQCCILGECKQCCIDDSCRSDPELYPVLLLHGHSFNSDNSPDYSLDAFNKIQSQLQEDGYVAAGTITPISNYNEIEQGEWGKIPKPIAVKGTFYRVSYYNLGSYSIATQKSENIETYAIRLKELIDLIKFRTGKDKVIIVTHSMGGLVARSYISIFGDENVYKLIMIGTPNEGINASVLDYCLLFGEKKECKDMESQSIFLKKLNDPHKKADIPMVNIIGYGCPMDSGLGDGVVLAGNAGLDNATNYLVNGTCQGFSKPLHTALLNIEEYPQVYDLIRKELKG